MEGTQSVVPAARLLAQCCMDGVLRIVFNNCHVKAQTSGHAVDQRAFPGSVSLLLSSIHPSICSMESGLVIISA